MEHEVVLFCVHERRWIYSKAVDMSDSEEEPTIEFHEMGLDDRLLQVHIVTLEMYHGIWVY